MKNTSNMRDIERAISQTVMFEAGILPMENAHHDMRRPLSQLSMEESRKARRKFRKAWRSALKEATKDTKSKVAIDQTQRRLGVGKKTPSRDERAARKQMVIDRVMKTSVKPMVHAFENPPDASKGKARTKQR